MPPLRHTDSSRDVRPAGAGAPQLLVSPLPAADRPDCAELGAPYGSWTVVAGCCTTLGTAGVHSRADRIAGAPHPGGAATEVASWPRSNPLRLGSTTGRSSAFPILRWKPSTRDSARCGSCRV